MFIYNQLLSSSMAAAAHLEEQPVPASDWKTWKNWCRLCANDDRGNMNVFLKHDGDATSGDLSLATAIGKYFWVNITRGEDLPEMICCECLTLVTSLVNFSERITRVQKLFCILQSASSKEVSLNVQELRSKFGLLEEAPGTEVHYVDEKPKVGIQVGLLPEEPELLEELENPLTPEGEQEEEDQAPEKGELSGASEFGDQDPVYEADEDAVLVKLCDAYEFSEKSSPCKEEVPCSPSPQGEEKDEKCELNLDQETDPDKSHQCTRCLRTYASARSLHRHMRQDHKAESGGSDLFTCSECSKKFRTHYQLERHSQRHLPLTDSKPKQHACNSCDKKFASSASASQHAQYMHLDERPRPVICEQCGVGLHSMSALKEHVLKHTDYAPFECEVCKKCFKSANRLKHHKETHDPHKYICPECGMQLNSRPTLNRHRLVHTDQMQHKCDYCGREFKRAKALKNHLILHTGLKPYSCDFCDRTFANGSNCRTHKKKAHPEELAAQEASGGGKTYNRNIPKLEALKAFTKNKDNLSPVATKQSGCFAFGKKPKPPVKENVRSLALKTDRNNSLQESESEPAPELAAQPDPSESAIPTIDNIYNHIMIEYH